MTTTTSAEPAPPAEGPEDVPATGLNDPFQQERLRRNWKAGPAFARGFGAAR